MKRSEVMSDRTVGEKEGEEKCSEVMSDRKGGEKEKRREVQ